MGNSDIEYVESVDLISLQAARVAIVAALEMHVHRSEELAGELAQINEDIERLSPEAGP